MWGEINLGSRLIIRCHWGGNGEEWEHPNAGKFTKILIVIANEGKQSQDVAIASLHFIPLAMTTSY